MLLKMKKAWKHVDKELWSCDISPYDYAIGKVYVIGKFNFPENIKNF